MRQILADEIRQRSEEGCDVTGFKVRLAETVDEPVALLEIYKDLMQLTVRDGVSYEEPTELEAIRAARPQDRPTVHPPKTVDDALRDRIHGAWLGRCAGLVLGKPFETDPFGNDAGALREYLEVAESYPLQDYPPQHPKACAAVGLERLPWSTCHRGKVAFVPADDDIHYTIAGLDVLERVGADFTRADVAHWWTHHLPVAAVFTAEEAALRNLMIKGSQTELRRFSETDWDEIRSWLNPYREWIGAQIRADGWAYACPGDPQRAAEFGWRDATLSHVKNGVYGEMFCAGMIAAALVLDDPHAIVQAGLAEIPERSRLAEAVRTTVAACNDLQCNADRFEEMIAWLWEHFSRYCVVHTINNAAAVTAALLLGGHDFEQVITIAVMSGWDTDCNGATAGSICGAMRGAERLPKKWIAPLKDTLRTDVTGYNPASIQDCAQRSAVLAEKFLHR